MVTARLQDIRECANEESILGRRPGSGRVALGRSSSPFRGLDLAILRRGRGDESVEQVGRRKRDLLDSSVESLGVLLGGLRRPADLAHVLKGGGSHLVGGRGWLEVVEGANVSAHRPSLMPGRAVVERSLPPGDGGGRVDADRSRDKLSTDPERRCESQRGRSDRQGTALPALPRDRGGDRVSRLEPDYLGVPRHSRVMLGPLHLAAPVIDPLGETPAELRGGLEEIPLILIGLELLLPEPDATADGEPERLDRSYDDVPGNDVEPGPIGKSDEDDPLVGPLSRRVGDAPRLKVLATGTLRLYLDGDR